MAASYHRNSTAVRNNVNLYCAQCESQIGIFDNEWIRLTSSYARSKEKGTHFGTEVGHRTQVVPQGPAQRLAEGCVMAEVFCCKCSNMVGQYCKSAPDAEKQSLVDQYFYKLTRTYLKDSRSHVKVEPVFGYGSDMIKPASSTSSMFPRSSMAPTSRWADTPLRQSSRTPAISLPGTNRSSARRELTATPSTTIDMADRKWEVRWEQSTAELQLLREEMTAQCTVIQEQSSILSAQSQRLDNQEILLRDQAACVEEHETCMSAQASHIVEQDQLIANQTKRLEEQQVHMSAITSQLNKLQKTMDDLKDLLSSSTQAIATPQLTQSPDSNTSDLNSVMSALKNAEKNVRELQSLRKANEAMKSRLNTIASAMGDISNVQMPSSLNTETSPPTTSDSVPVLGKRKRSVQSKRPSLVLKAPAAQFRDNAEQMPTPQASDRGQQSPEQTPSERNTRTDIEENSNGNEQSALEITQADETAVVAGMNEIDDGDAAMSDISPQRLVNIDNNTEPDPPAPTVPSKAPIRRTRGGRISIPTAKAAERRRGRPSKAKETMEVHDADNESSVLEPASTDERRVTRSSTKAPKSNDINDSKLEHAADHEIQLPPMLDHEAGLTLNDDFEFPQPPLSSVQLASSVLGMNLEALLVSSQALRQGVDSAEQTTDPTMATIQDEQSVTVDMQQSEIDLSPFSDTQNGTNDSHADAVEDPDTLLEQSGQLEFIQDSGIYDVLDSSDEEDDLMQPDTALYGEDSLDMGNVQFSSVLTGFGGSHNSGHAEDTTALRAGRSMAPEPIKIKKKSTSNRKLITLDKVHMATPRLFAEAYAAGRQPKAARPTPMQARERALNEELTELGLSQWIGKNKKSKEYRDLVTAARARFRNSNKAAFLRSKGFSYDLSDPSSVLPETRAQRAANAQKNMPLNDIENVPGPAQSAAGEVGGTDAGADEEEQISKDQPRTTRARTRRSSVPLVSSLGEGSDQTNNGPVKQSTRKRKSAGSRKSVGDSCVTIQQDEEGIHPDIPDENLVNSAAITPDISNGDATDNVIKQGTKRRKSSGRPRSGARRSTGMKPTSDLQIEQQGQVISEEAPLTLPPETPTLSISQPRAMPGITPHTSVSEKANQNAEIKTAAQRREEAILLRDRMAKELMEREMMEL